MLIKVLLVLAVTLLAWIALRRRDSRHRAVATLPDRPLTAADAAAVLGVAPGSSAAQIKAAHRRLMAGLHPDKGGSDYLARQINDARTVLLATLDR